MKKYHIIEPEVIVGLGEKTIFLEKEPPFKTVTNLHIELEDWLGDDLVECYPCYLITEQLRNGILEQNFSGFEIKDVNITKSEYFQNNYSLRKEVPSFYWLIINGIQDKDDLYLGLEKKLYSSDLFLEYMKNNYSIKYLEIDPERNEFDDLIDQMIAESKSKK